MFQLLPHQLQASPLGFCQGPFSFVSLESLIACIATGTLQNLSGGFSFLSAVMTLLRMAAIKACTCNALLPCSFRNQSDGCGGLSHCLVSLPFQPPRYIFGEEVNHIAINALGHIIYVLQSCRASGGVSFLFAVMTLLRRAATKACTRNALLPCSFRNRSDGCGGSSHCSVSLTFRPPRYNFGDEVNHIAINALVNIIYENDQVKDVRFDHQ